MLILGTPSWCGSFWKMYFGLKGMESFLEFLGGAAIVVSGYRSTWLMFGLGF